jgi:hypothetical protein
MVRNDFFGPFFMILGLAVVIALVVLLRPLAWRTIIFDNLTGTDCARHFEGAFRPRRDRQG